MTTARRRFSQEFKDELCQEVISTSKPIREVAQAYGVGTTTLCVVQDLVRPVCGGFPVGVLAGFRPCCRGFPVMGVAGGGFVF